MAVSPLQDTEFNRYKSDIKFLDYCSIGAAGIFSQLRVYQPTVQDRITGFLVPNEHDEWIEVMKELISDGDLRQEVARQANCYLFQERILARCIQNWERALEVI